MLERLKPGTPRVLCREAFGVPFRIQVAHRSLEAGVEAILPPGSTPCESDAPAAQFSLERFRDGYEVTRGADPLANGLELQVALRILNAQLRYVIAAQSPDAVFVHAGAVAIDNRAIVIPGRTFAGKTSLVAELLRQGAHYLSDEYAVLDADGRVHPYPRPLSIRDPDARHRPGRASQVDTPASNLGGVVATGAHAVAVIAAVSYDPTADWSVRTRSPAQGAALLMANAPAARTSTARVLSVARRAAVDAAVLEGTRGEAAAAASRLLELVCTDGRTHD